MMLNNLLSCKDEVVDVSPVIQGGPLTGHVISGKERSDCSEISIAQMKVLVNQMEQAFLETGDQAIVSRFIDVLNQIEDEPVILTGLQGVVECGAGLVCLKKPEPYLRGYLEALSTPVGILGDKTVKAMILEAKTLGKKLLEIAFDNAFININDASDLEYCDEILVTLFDHGADPNEQFSNDYTANELLDAIFPAECLPRCRARLSEGGPKP